MSHIVLMVSSDGKSETFANASARPVRIDLPEGAVIGLRDKMSGEWQPFFREQRKRHRFADFSLLDGNA